MKNLNSYDFSKLYSTLRKPINIIAFLSTLICGLIIHFSMAANDFLIRDGIWNNIGGIHISGKWEASLGRWGLHIVDKTRLGVINTYMIIVLSLFFLALTSVLLCNMFKVQNKIVALCISLSIAAAPQLVNIFSNIYCADSYCLSILLATASIFLMFNKIDSKIDKLRIPLSIIFLAVSLSLYQTSIGVATSLIMFLFFNMLKDNEPITTSIKKVFKSFVFVLCGSVIYYIIAVLYARHLGVKFSSYGGADKLGFSSSLKSIPNNIANAYTFTYNYFFSNSVVKNYVLHRYLLWLIFFSLFIIVFILFAIKNQDLDKKVIRLILMALCILIIPIFLATILFINPFYNLCLVISTPWMFVLPCILAISCGMAEKTDLRFYCNAPSIFVSLIIIWSCMWQTGASYTALGMTCRQASTIAQNIYCKATDLDDYSDKYPYCFIGSYLKNQGLKGEIYNRAIGTATAGLDFSTDNGRAGTWNYFFKYTMGISINTKSEKQAQSIRDSEEFKSMPCYPMKGSVKVIDKTIVVKFDN